MRRFNLAEFDDVVHHSIEKDVDGNFWVPVQLSPSTGNAKCLARLPDFTEDAVRQISTTGETIFTKSLLEIFQENDLDLMLTGRGHFNKDPFHLNDIQPALETTENWYQGDLFLSIRDQSMIMHYRPSTNEVINIMRAHLSINTMLTCYRVVEYRSLIIMPE